MARVGIGIRGLAPTRSFRATESSTVRLAGDSIRHSLRSTLRFSLATDISITILTLTAEAGIGVCTTIRASAAAAIMPVMDMRRRADTLVVVSAAAAQADFMAAGSLAAEVASLEAVVVDLAVECTVTKDKRLGYEQRDAEASRFFFCCGARVVPNENRAAS